MQLPFGGDQCGRPAQGGYKVPWIAPKAISGLEKQDVSFSLDPSTASCHL